MKRLTFGVRSSPFIATRVIRHLAETHRQSHPLASQSILRDFYVDDFLSGASSLAEADHIRTELCALLKSAGMNLRKWRSNSSEFRDTIPKELIETADLQLPAPLASSKALGMHWDVSHDTFHVAIPEIDEKPITKRLIASLSAKVYDILGFFAPATITSKIILQEAWKSQVSWDSPIPDALAEKWKAWTSELSSIANRPVPKRLVISNQQVIFMSLHGFADASNSAYGAVIYLRAVHSDTSVSTSLVYSKARVTPIKATTIPRMELVAALLLSKMLVYISNLLEISSSQLYAWSDSQIVLCWLKKPPSSLKTFVSHRVAAIQQSIPSNQWRHVPSKENPADLLSRGIKPSLLPDSELWWNSPEWLKLDPSQWLKQRQSLPSSIPELKIPILLSSVTPKSDSFWTRYSSFNHLVRLVAWLRRFVLNTRLPRIDRLTNEVLTSSEIQSSKHFLFRLSQQETYCEVFDALAAGTMLPKGHSLFQYDVSLGSDRLLHISGHIRQADDSTKAQTLIPLSLKSYITKRFISSSHSDNFHPGISSMLCILAGTYHIPGLKRHLKFLSRHCAVCQKAYAKPLAPRMGMLPSSRTTPSPPFNITGIDFADHCKSDRVIPGRDRFISAI